MSHHSKMVGVVVIGLMHLVSGIAGIAVGGGSLQVGWWLVGVGLLLTVLAWRDLRGSQCAAKGRVPRGGSATGPHSHYP